HTRFSRDWSSDVCSSDLEIDFEWLIIELAELIKNYPSLKLSKNYETLLNYIIQSNSKLIEIYSHTKVNNKKFKKSIDVLLSDLRSEERRVGKECRSQRAR